MADSPVINGRHYSYASAEINLDGLVYKGITSINFKESLKPTKVVAGGVYPQGKTRGEYNADADLEMLIQHANAFRAALAAKHPNGSYALVEFPVLIYFSEAEGEPVHEVKIVNCRWQDTDNSNSKGPDPSVEKIVLCPDWIERDGLRMLAPADAGGR